MNRIKDRQWCDRHIDELLCCTSPVCSILGQCTRPTRRYRPSAPMTTEEATQRLFGIKASSPYMSFAPLLLDEAAAALPAISHLDSTARVQTVSADDDEWLYRLLVTVGTQFGWPVLLNTSLNHKGRPIVNTIRGVFEMLDSIDDIHALVIEDYAFTRTPGPPISG